MKRLAPFIIGIISACSTTPTVEQRKTPETEKAVASSNLRNDLKETYGPYASIRATFTVKGKVEKQDVYYLGTIYSDTKKLVIDMEDPVFRSKLFRMTVTGENITQQDFLHEKKYTANLRDFRWVEVFGRSFPFRLFLPLLRGFPPDEFFSPVATEATNRVIYKDDTYDLAAEISEKKIRNLYFRLKNQKEILIITFQGEKTNKLKRHFPAELLITHNNATEDYLKLSFGTVTLR